MDATLIAAAPSTRNEASKRDPQMSQSKKGNQWYFGMKAHIGVDAKSGLVHTVKTTTGKVHDAKMTDDLIRADDTIILGDPGERDHLGGERQAQAGTGFVVFAKAV